MAITEGFALHPSSRPPRRVRRFWVDAQAILETFKQSDWPDHITRYTGMPQDARVVGSGSDGSFHRFYIDVESEAFPACETIPGWQPMPLRVDEDTFTFPPGVLKALRVAAGFPEC